MTSAARENIGPLVDTMKRASVALREVGIEFMLGGGLAIWARAASRPLRFRPSEGGQLTGPRGPFFAFSQARVLWPP